MTKSTQQPGPSNMQPQHSRLHRHNPAMLVLTILSPLILAFFSYKSFISPSSILPTSEPDVPISGGSATPEMNLDQPCPLPSTRYSIHTGQAACYPSSGGIWLAELEPLELQHLNIDRFSTTPRPDLSDEDEDAFCHKLRVFGGSWYNPDPEGRDLFVGGEYHELDEFEPAYEISRRVGFSVEGGVCVLDVDEGTGSFPDGMVGVRNALTMEERCEALQKLGAVDCEDVEGCSLLDDLTKEPWELAGGRDEGLHDAL